MGNVTPFTQPGGPKLGAPQPISENHDPGQFDCGNAELNEWLRKRAIENNGRFSRTYVVCLGPRIVGFYTLASGAVLRNQLPTAKLRKNSPENIPVIVVGRLAVDVKYHGQGIGSGMLKEAIFRTIEASQNVGVRAIVVHAVNDEAIAFYLNYGFSRSQIDRRTLILPIETAIVALEE